jgi:hypothetical protein
VNRGVTTEETEEVMQASSSVLGRLSGLATVLGGVLWAVGGATSLNATAVGIGMEGPHLVLTLAGLLSLLGLARLASHHTSRYGRAGVAGVLVAGAGVALVIASKNLPASVSEEVGWTLFYAGGILLVVGSLLIGTVALALSKAWLLGGSLVAIGVFAILQVALLMVPAGEPGPLATIVLPVLNGTAWTALGYALWSRAGEAVGRAPSKPVTAHDWTAGQGTQA